MKKYLLFFMLFLSFSLFGQEPKAELNDAFPDFTKMNVDTNARAKDLLINEIDTIVELFTDFTQDENIVAIESDKQIIAARRYFPNSRIIHQEYIKVDKNTYHYLENDSLNNHRLMAEGKLLASTNTFVDYDTICKIDPVSYDVYYQIIKHPKLLKEGEWFESDSVFIYRGNYKNDKREGKWFKMKRMWHEYDQRDLVYQNDSLISEIQLNLVKRGDFNALKKGLIGSWSVDVFDEKKKILNLKKPIGFTVLKFSEDGNFDITGYDHVLKREKSLDSWTVNDKCILEINRLGKIERYQLLLVLENRIESIILGK
jgi:hypothetical protein